jgi:Icc-related predicted phosphoesterase
MNDKKRVLVTADTHGGGLRSEYGSNIDDVLGKADALVVVGDVFDDYNGYGLEFLPTGRIPTYLLLGNDDADGRNSMEERWELIKRDNPEVFNLEESPLKIGKFYVVGVNGCTTTPFKDEYQYFLSEDEIEARFRLQLDRILLGDGNAQFLLAFHALPYGFLDESVLFKNFYLSSMYPDFRRMHFSNREWDFFKEMFEKGRLREHTGSEALLKLLDEYPVIATFGGHIHEGLGRAEYLSEEPGRSVCVVNTSRSLTSVLLGEKSFSITSI